MLPISGSELVALIPQKPPFVFIGALVERSENRCITTFQVDDQHILCHQGLLTPGGILENIAQTCAAKAGYECWLAGLPVPLGFIGDIKDFTYTRLPRAGEQLSTEVLIENQIFDVSIIVGKVFVQQEEIASCRMKIFIDQEKENSL